MTILTTTLSGISKVSKTSLNIASISAPFLLKIGSIGISAASYSFEIAIAGGSFLVILILKNL